MNRAVEDDPIFWDLRNLLIWQKFVEINPKYWIMLKRRQAESAYRLSEKNMAEY